SREIAIEYTAEVSKLVIGKWSDPRSMYKEKHGNLMKPSARAAVLQSVRIFFRDLQEWGLIPVNFNPDRVFQLPRSIRPKIGPDPRVVPD
ncbi:site-specific integrase, partial [Acinetobacter baumannii]